MSASTLQAPATLAAGRPGELPNTFVPISYDILIQTDLERKTFAGSGSILVKQTAKKASELVFHLDPETTLLTLALAGDPASGAPAVELPPSAYRRDARWQQVVVSLASLPVDSGHIGRKLRVDIAWSGKLAMSPANGFYLSSYSDAPTDAEGAGSKDDPLKYYAQTQFQPTGARKAFPCFDEPGLKATFQMRMLVRPDHVAINNMPELSSRPAAVAAAADGVDARLLKLFARTRSSSAVIAADLEELKLVKFGQTPLMSSYLVAFATGDFQYVEDSYVSKRSGRTIPLRIYSTPNAVHELDSALHNTKLTVTLWEEVFQIGFPLPKLDTLSCSNFGGGMENFGLILNTERLMRLPSDASQAARNGQLGLIAHECAHQWFGDLVTCEGWEQLWLNEGFASICGSLFAPAMLLPETRAREAFIASEVWGALAADSRRTSHPIEVSIEDPTRINDIFDAITYKKGASVLAMIASWVGEKTFLKGVGNYLREHAFGNATTLDLWKSIGEASGKDVAKVAKNWTQEMGYPVIKARLRHGSKLHLKQNRFLATGDVKAKDDIALWHVPLQLRTFGANGKTELHSIVLSERETVIDLKGAESFLLNAGSSGVYRVAYDVDTLLALAKEAVESPDRITAVDSLAILNDAYGLARAGYLPSTVLLSVVRTLAHPRQEHALFSGIALILDDLLGLFFADMHTYRAIQRMRRELFGPVVARLGFDFSDDNSAETIQLRTLAIKEAGLAGHEVVVDWALQQWAASIEDGQTLSANTRAVIWSLAVIHIGEPAHTRLTDLFVTAKSTTDKTDAVTALCQTTSRDLVDRTLSLIDDVAGVKDIDGRLVGILRGLSTNPRWRAVTWAWTRNHYDALWKVLQGSMGGRYVPLLTLPRIARRADLDEAAAFFRTKDTSEFKASLAQTYETVEASIRFLERDADKGDEVARWFRKHGHKAEPKRVVPAPRAGAAAAVRPESSLLYLF